MLVDGTVGGDYLCPVCRDKAMAHMLGELQVKQAKAIEYVGNSRYWPRRQNEERGLVAFRFYFYVYIYFGSILFFIYFFTLSLIPFQFKHGAEVRFY